MLRSPAIPPRNYGMSATTVWRYRKKKMLTTLNIDGRLYILRSEIARFNERAAAGEFAKTHITPKELRSP